MTWEGNMAASPETEVEIALDIRVTVLLEAIASLCGRRPWRTMFNRLKEKAS
jgi:hypothetical protein